MAVYNVNSNYFNENADMGNTDIDFSGVQESAYENPMEGAMACIVESEENYNAIMQAVGVQELAHFERTGEEMVYEASTISSFFGKAKEFFKKMWEKIKGLFAKFFAAFDSMTKSDKDFVNKYKARILKANTSNFKYKGYNFTTNAVVANDDYDSLFTTILKGVSDKIGSEASVVKASDLSEAEIKSVLEKLEDKTEILETMRGSAINESSLSASEFSKELYAKLRSGENTKEELDNVNVSTQINIISNAAKAQKDAKKAYSTFEKLIKKNIKELETSERKLNKDITTDNAKSQAMSIRFANSMIAISRDALNLCQIVNGAKLTAIKDENRQAKAICLAVMNYKPKNESVDFTDEDNFGDNGFLGNVVLR